jgi:HopA1 effector protein family/Lanthionine synthetase C-like protein
MEHTRQPARGNQKFVRDDLMSSCKRPDYREQIGAAVEATVLNDYTRLSWLGEDVSDYLLRPQSAIDGSTEARNTLCRVVTWLLYRAHYCLGAPARPSANWFDSLPDQILIDAFSKANADNMYDDVGWRVTRLDADSVVCERDHVSVRVRRSTVVGPSPQEGAHVTLRLPCERLALQPGFYLVWGQAGLPEEASLVRVYLSVTVAGSTQLLRDVTARLNRKNIRFQLKLVTHPAAFERLDAVVLYLSCNDLLAFLPELARLSVRCYGHLRRNSPTLTRSVLHGVALAQSRGLDSFGFHRSGLLAEGIIRAFESGATTLETKMSIVEDVLTSHEIEIDAPYRSIGQNQEFWSAIDAWQPAGTRKKTGPARQEKNRDSRSRIRDQANLIATARAVGMLLCENAIWADGGCTWLAPLVAEDGAAGGRGVAACRTIGPSYATGTSGVAMFLASLMAATADERFMRTALGAAHHAVNCSDMASWHMTPGFFDGLAGVAMAAGAVGNTAKNERLIASARRIADQIANASWATETFDPGIARGAAGVIMGLLWSSVLLGDRTYVDAALRIAERLITVSSEGAGQDKLGEDWRTAEYGGASILLADGIAISLLEMYAFSSEPECRNKAVELLHRERNAAPTQGAAMSAVPVGLAGFALARLRWFEVTPSNESEAAASEACRKVKRTVATFLESGYLNDNCWRWLSSLVEILCRASERFENDIEARQLVERALTAGMGKDPSSGYDWSSVVPHRGAIGGQSAWANAYLRGSGARGFLAALPFPEDESRGLHYHGGGRLPRF